MITTSNQNLRAYIKGINYLLCKRSTDRIPLNMMIGVVKKTNRSLLDYLILEFSYRFYNLDESSS